MASIANTSLAPTVSVKYATSAATSRLGM